MVIISQESKQLNNRKTVKTNKHWKHWRQELVSKNKWICLISCTENFLPTLYLRPMQADWLILHDLEHFFSWPVTVPHHRHYIPQSRWLHKWTQMNTTLPTNKHKYTKTHMNQVWTSTKYQSKHITVPWALARCCLIRATGSPIATVWFILSWICSATSVWVIWEVVFDR